MYATRDALKHVVQNSPIYRTSPAPTSTSTTTISRTRTRTITLSSQPTQVYTSGLDGTNQTGNFFFIDLLLVFFALVGLVLLLLRIYKLAYNYIRQLFASGPGRDHQAHFAVNTTSFWPWIKRYILYAPLWKSRHNKEIQLSSAVSIGTLPSRLHAAVLMFYLLSNIVYCAYLDYNQSRPATLAELRGRSGALAAFNLIPTVLFALRGNPLVSIMRVSYDTFNLFHRGLARIVILETIVHVVAWASTCIIENGLPSIGLAINMYPSLQWGTTAAVTFCVMGILAWSPFRHAFYETFVNSHRLFAFLGLLGAYKHLKLSHLPQVPYVVLAAIFWAADWMARGASVLYYNCSRHHLTTVTVQALPNDACRLTFDLARPWKYRPGAHVHVYLPKVGLWSSHPFSLAWSEDSQLASLDEEKSPDPASAVMGLDAPTKVRTSVSLIVRARSGLTRKLFDKASASPKKITSAIGAIEGPYGGHESLDSYGTVLLFAGGVGITHQLGYVRHLVEGYEAATVAARKVVLVWSIPEVENLEWVRPWMDEVLRLPKRREVLKVLIHVTKGTVSVMSKTGSVIMAKGRCNIQHTVDEEFLERKGAMVVTVCGPGSFADDVRLATRKRVQLGCVDFIEEAFTY